MRKRIKVFIVLIILTFSFSQKVYGESVYYLSSDDNRREIFKADSFEFYGNFTNEEKAYILFEILFSGEYCFVPLGTKVIDLYIMDGLLLLNMTKDIMYYGGGSSYERRLIAQILKTALDISTVDRVTLSVEGLLVYFPEGSLIYDESIIPEF